MWCTLRPNRTKVVPRFLKAHFFVPLCCAMPDAHRAQPEAGPNRRDLLLYSVLFTLAGGLLPVENGWLGLTAEYWAMVGARVLCFEVYHYIAGPALAVELDSLSHSALCTWLSIIYLANGGAIPLPVEHMLKTHSYVYFLHDLARNFALYFNGGFSLMFAVHHVLSICLLGMSLSFGLGWICSSLVVTEWTNILRAREQIYLLHNNFSTASRGSTFRRRLRMTFELSFVFTRLVVTPGYTAMWIWHIAEKMPPLFLMLLILLSALINIGGGVWSFLIIRKRVPK